jgi:hypothetical protein
MPLRWTVSGKEHCVSGYGLFQRWGHGEICRTYSPPSKKRLGNHKKLFKHEKYAHDTTLRSYIWKLKDRNLDFDIKWKLMARATPFSPVTNVFYLCTRETYFILIRPETATINSRNEINSHCRHKQSMLLDKT